MFCVAVGGVPPPFLSAEALPSAVGPRFDAKGKRNAIFNPFSVLQPLDSKAVQLDKSAFEPCRATVSLPFADVASTGCKAPYYSPGYGNMHQNIMDLYALRATRDSNYETLDDMWLGMVCNANHKIVIATKRPAMQGWDYFFAIDYYTNNCAILWPCVQKTLVPGRFVFIPFHEIAEPTIMPITTWDPEKIKACAFQWWPWEKQLEEIGRRKHTFKPAIRAVGDAKGFRPIKEVASEQAWWEIGFSELRAVYKHLQFAALPRGNSTADLLFALVQNCLPTLSAEQVMEIIYQRLAKLKAKSCPSSALHETDAAIEVHRIWLVLGN